jgi:hypothetical protein
LLKRRFFRTFQFVGKMGAAVHGRLGSDRYPCASPHPVCVDIRK